jgi:hypothetical protein
MRPVDELLDDIRSGRISGGPRRILVTRLGVSCEGLGAKRLELGRGPLDLGLVAPKPEQQPRVPVNAIGREPARQVDGGCSSQTSGWSSHEAGHRKQPRLRVLRLLAAGSHPIVSCIRDPNKIEATAALSKAPGTRRSSTGSPSAFTAVRAPRRTSHESRGAGSVSRAFSPSRHKAQRNGPQPGRRRPRPHPCQLPISSLPRSDCEVVRIRSLPVFFEVP